MVTLIGIILLALGLSLAVVWQTSVMDVLMGVIPLTLIFWGGLAVLIGYSEIKARREYRKAVGDGEADEAANARGTRRRYARDQGEGVTPTASNPAASGSTPPKTSQPSPPNHSTP